MIGKLYIVGTPIGNMGDFSSRAANTLSSVDFIAAEDTRVTSKLLGRWNIKKSMVSYHEHNRSKMGDSITTRIESGESCALVTDAGMPAVSDPGQELVALCADKGIEVVAVPGPCAAITALALSGLPSGRFTFEGFLSVNKKNRNTHLQSLINEERTMIFYEAPHKLISTLADFLEAFGNRRLSIAREITKLHEEVIRTDLETAVSKYNDETPKGEFVLVLEGKKEDVAEQYTLKDALKLARSYLEQGAGASEASKKAASVTKHKKSDIYRLLQEDGKNEV